MNLSLNVNRKTNKIMELEKKHLAPYLPYKLKVELTLGDQSELPWYMEEDGIYTLEGMMLDWYPQEVKIIKPILRPLSDLYKDNGKDAFINSNDIEHISKYDEVKTLQYCTVEYLISKHYDVFKLIPKGLAIDINTLK